jgi:hypothetical protein
MCRRKNPVRTCNQIWNDPLLTICEESRIVLPCSPIAGAIAYALNQWDALSVYATQGFLAIDNNAAKCVLKRVASGRKN